MKTVVILFLILLSGCYRSNGTYIDLARCICARFGLPLRTVEHVDNQTYFTCGRSSEMYIVYDDVYVEGCSK